MPCVGIITAFLKFSFVVSEGKRCMMLCENCVLYCTLSSRGIVDLVMLYDNTGNAKLAKCITNLFRCIQLYMRNLIDVHTDQTFSCFLHENQFHKTLHSKLIPYKICIMNVQHVTNINIICCPFYV